MDMAEEGENKNDMYSGSCDYIRSFPGHGFMLLEQLNVQRYYGSFCDITVRIDDVDYQAHRCILAASSSKLQSLIFSIRQEWNNVLVIKDVTPTAFQVILDFMYTGSVRLMSTSIHDVLESARYLEMPEVEKVCLNYIDCMHSGQERNIANSCSIRFMPELAPITEVQLDGQMSTTLSKITEAGAFDVVAHGIEKAGSARAPVLHNLYNSKSGLPFFSPTGNTGISIETIDNYLKLVETRQGSLTAASSGWQNWSPLFEMRSLDNDDGFHRVLPNLVRINDSCSSQLHDEDRTSVISVDNQRIKFPNYSFDKSVADSDPVGMSRDAAATSESVDNEMFDYESSEDEHEDECASFLKISPLSTSLMTNENCDDTKENLHVMEAGSSCIPFGSHREGESFSQMRCEDLNIEARQANIEVLEIPLSKMANIDSVKRNRKKAPKKLRAAEVSSSDDSTCTSKVCNTPTYSADVHNSTFSVTGQESSAFVSDVQDHSTSLASKSCDLSNCTVVIEKIGRVEINTSSGVQDYCINKQKVKFSSSSRTNKPGVAKSKISNKEIKDGVPIRPFKKRIKVGQKRDCKDNALFVCTLCNKKFGRASELTRHQRNHAVQTYRCHYCPSEFSNPVLYKRHFICMHGERNAFFCVYPSCKFRSDRLSNIEKHAIIHTDIKLFTCPHCGKSFSQDNGLRSHLLSCTQAQSYLCDICGAKFNHLQSMRSHRRVHTGEKPYRCTDCGSQFADHRNFKRHRRIHENIFPYPCVFCDKRFRHSNSLKAHMSVHEIYQSTK